MTHETLLHRQVHPSWIQEGRVTSQAFKPTPKDEGMLSVYDGDVSGPEESWRHHRGAEERLGRLRLRHRGRMYGSGTTGELGQRDI